MANKVGRIKLGMGGSRGGRGRSETTEVMKKHSRKLRRQEALRAITEELSAKRNKQA